jgi:RND family efflux transporter MFP subunit
MEQSDTSLANAKADVEQFTAQRELAQNQSRYTRLVADQNGVITSENADEGAVLAAGQPVFGFAVAGARDVTIDVAEDRIGSISAGQAAQVSLPTHPGVSLAAQVRDVAKAADPQSRTFRIKLTLTKPETVKPGISAVVTLNAAAPVQFVTIPASALFHKGGDTAVWIVDPKTSVLQLRQVVVARYGPDQVVLSRGVHTGEEFVTKGVNTVIDGSVVQTTPDTTLTAGQGEHA